MYGQNQAFMRDAGARLQSLRTLLMDRSDAQLAGTSFPRTRQALERLETITPGLKLLGFIDSTQQFLIQDESYLLRLSASSVLHEDYPFNLVGSILADTLPLQPGDAFASVRLLRSHRYYRRPKLTKGIEYQVHWLRWVLVVGRIRLSQRPPHWFQIR